MLFFLNELGRYLIGLINEYFDGDPKVVEYVKVRLSKARELILDHRRPYRGVVDTPVASAVTIYSSEYVVKGPPRTIKLKSLDGDLVEVQLGTDLERAFHSVKVSKFSVKCTCDDANMLTSIADRVLRCRLRREVPTYKYTLCKHTLAELGRKLALRHFTLNDPELRKTLFMMLVVTYARVHRTLPPPKALEVLKGLMVGGGRD